MGRLVHTGLGSSSLVAHVLPYPPPPPHVNSFVLGPAVINTHTSPDSITFNGRLPPIHPGCLPPDRSYANKLCVDVRVDALNTSREFEWKNDENSVPKHHVHYLPLQIPLSLAAPPH
jgi:hypothetical protein